MRNLCLLHEFVAYEAARKEASISKTGLEIFGKSVQTTSVW